MLKKSLVALCVGVAVLVASVSAAQATVIVLNETAAVQINNPGVYSYATNNTSANWVNDTSYSGTASTQTMAWLFNFAIPAEALGSTSVIKSATLSITYGNTTNAGQSFTASRIIRAWDPVTSYSSGLGVASTFWTGNNASSPNSTWNTGANLTHVGTTSSATQTLDVTTFTQYWQSNPTKAFGMALYYFNWAAGHSWDGSQTLKPMQTTLTIDYSVPEPATMCLLALGGIGMLLRRRNR